MAEISFKIDVRAVRDKLQDDAGSLVKRIVDARKNACIYAVGEVLDEHRYLPKDTTWEAFNGACWFSVDKGTKADLAHYFHEGQIYGPNIPIFERDSQGNKTGKILRFFSPKGKPKQVIYPMSEHDLQGIGKPSGVYHWTDAVKEGGALYQELLDKCEEILRR